MRIWRISPGKSNLKQTLKSISDLLFPGNRDVSNWEIKVRVFKALGHLKKIKSGHPNDVYQEIKKKKKCKNEV